MTVDGTNRTAPYNTSWQSGSSHTISVTSPQSVGQDRYTFSSWSDGGGQSHSVSPASTATFTATFTTQHFVSTRTEPNGIGITGGGQWYSHNASAFVGPAPTMQDYTFSYWRRDGSQNIGSNPSGVTVTVDASLLVEAVYTTAQKQPLQLVDSDTNTSPSAVNPGGRVTLSYRVYNPNSSAVTIALGASIKLGSGSWINDQANDRTLSAPAGYSTQTRYFDVPSSAAAGNYTVWYAIRDGGITGSAFDELQRNDLTLEARTPQSTVQVALLFPTQAAAMEWEEDRIQFRGQGTSGAAVRITRQGESFATLVGANNSWEVSNVPLKVGYNNYILIATKADYATARIETSLYRLSQWEKLSRDTAEAGELVGGQIGLFVEGALLGEAGLEFNVPGSNSVSYFAGWLVVGTIPGIDIIPDARDFIVVLPSGDKVSIITNGVALLPFVLTDVPQIGKSTAKFLTKNPDKVDDIAKWLRKNLPSVTEPVAKFILRTDSIPNTTRIKFADLVHYDGAIAALDKKGIKSFALLAEYNEDFTRLNKTLDNLAPLGEKGSEKLIKKINEGINAKNWGNAKGYIHETYAADHVAKRFGIDKIKELDAPVFRDGEQWTDLDIVLKDGSVFQVKSPGARLDTSFERQFSRSLEESKGKLQYIFVGAEPNLEISDFLRAQKINFEVIP